MQDSPSCPEGGELPAVWIHGSDPVNDPALQVHAYNGDFYILRQSMCLNFEGPFLYLIVGEHTAVLFDTGASGDPPVAATVQGILAQRARDKGIDHFELIVAHTHSHGDHIGNDSQFVGAPNTTVLGSDLPDVQAAYGLPDWPDGKASLDLGGRVLDILPTPGHQTTHISIYDRRTQILLAGDTFYPGFLFISDFPEYRKSIDKLVAFTAENPVRWILGNHIEMTDEPGLIYPYGTEVQARERVLQLERKQLLELSAALAAMADEPVEQVHDDFVITP